MKFTKMHGIGNDYVYINCFEETVEDPHALSRQVSDRHFGIGSDGLILIKPSETCDFMMEMYNVDGTQGEMCGNAIRCVAKYVYDKGMTDKTTITVETLGGIKTLELTVEDGKVVLVKVNMGAPILENDRIPVINDKHPAIDAPIMIDGVEYRMNAISMGNPHTVLFWDDVMNMEIEKIGPAIENHPDFSERVNVEFVEVLDRTNINMRVWERGSAETLACGTGASASVVACVLNGKTEDEVTVHLRGGDLLIKWDRAENLVYMTGPATTVFDGEF